MITGKLQLNIDVSTPHSLLAFPDVPAYLTTSVNWWPALDVRTRYLFWQPRNSESVPREWHQACWTLPVEYPTSLGTTPSVNDIEYYIDVGNNFLTPDPSFCEVTQNLESRQQTASIHNILDQLATLHRNREGNDDRHMKTDTKVRCGDAHD